jgi:zinc/manganese transport system permease protein
VSLIGAGFLATLALAVSLSAVTIGAILSTALIVGPAATALRLTRRPLAAVMVAAAVGVTATWAGVILSYDSYYWSSTSGTWPVSFFVVSTVLAAYLASATVRR